MRLYSKTEAADKEVVDAVDEAAARLRCTRAQVALAWLLQRPGVTAPIVGATKSHHLEEAIAALAVQLGERTVTALVDKYLPHALSFSE